MTQNALNKSRKWFTVSWQSTDRQTDRQMKFMLRPLERGSLTLTPIISFFLHVLCEKICRVGYTELFYMYVRMLSQPCLPTLCHSAIPTSCYNLNLFLLLYNCTSVRHRALELVASVLYERPNDDRRNTQRLSPYLSQVRNFSCSAWNRRITSSCV